MYRTASESDSALHPQLMITAMEVTKSGKLHTSVLYPVAPEAARLVGARLLVPQSGVSRLWGYLWTTSEIARWIPVLPASGTRAAGGKSDCPSEEATKPERGPRGVCCVGTRYTIPPGK